MSQYITSPFRQPPILLTPGKPEWLYGSYNSNTGDTTAIVLSDSAVGTVATIVVKITGGNIPVVGALLTVIGTSNSAGVFNTVNTPILSVSAAQAPDQGVFSLTYTIATTAQTSTPDSGLVRIPQPEVGETVIAASSIPVAMPYGATTFNQNQAITTSVFFPSTLPTTATVNLQQSLGDFDPQYQNVAVVASIVAGAVVGGNASGYTQTTIDPSLGRFFRFNISGLTGPASTIVAKLMM